MRKSVLGFFTGLMAITLFISINAAFAVPESINLQGKLTDAEGNPLHGIFSMSFYLFDSETEGTLVWEETQSVVASQGIYSVQLGISSTLDVTVFDHSELFLEVVIEGETLSPRQSLTSTAFSMKAADSEMLNGMTVWDFALSDHKHAFADISGAITDGMIPDDITIDYASEAGIATNATNADYATAAEDSDTVDGKHASSFASTIHNHSAKDIVAGTLSNDLYSAYSDLGAEGYLNNNSGSDLPTRSQADSLYLNASGDTATGAIVVDNNLSVYDTLSIGTNNANDDDYIRMDSPGTEYLRWNDNPGNFHFSDDLALTGTLQTGGVNNEAYNRFGSGLPSSGDIDNTGDVLITNDLEVGGVIYNDGMYKYTEPKTHHLFLHAVDFSPNLGYPAPYQQENLWMANSHGGRVSCKEIICDRFDLTVYASASLPEGATITEIRLYYFDYNDLYDFEVRVDFYQIDYTDHSWSYHRRIATIGPVSTSGSSSENQSFYADIIDEPPVENSRFSYVLAFNMTSEDQHSFRILGVRITYEMDSVAP